MKTRYNMKYSAQYHVFPATFDAISWKINYLWDSVYFLKQNGIFTAWFVTVDPADLHGSFAGKQKAYPTVLPLVLYEDAVHVDLAGPGRKVHTQ